MHPHRRLTRAACLLAVFAAAGCRSAVTPPKPATAVHAVDDAALRASDGRAADWLTHGRTYDEQRFSPLEQIRDGNVERLGLAWIFDTKTRRGLEATPIVVDGVLYTTGSWSVVFAIDARTGREIWKWDPQVPRAWAQRACCDVVNRGVAVYRGKVYVGVLDGRLAALDARTGEPIWTVTTVDQSKPYTITGAPRVVKGKVVIGNGGAEFGVRGYVTAYDAESGKQAWRFFTVPGDPSLPFENEAMERAAETWKGEWWKMGGGGTVWDSMAYDPALDLLYVGTGNGSPWNREVRSPGGGDNLYLSSILALRPDTGELVWHYQTTPGDSWDFTATQHMILADLEIEGRQRKVLMQAPKNGFFYVLDRSTGELLSAEPYVGVTWASGVDMKTGRPIETPGSRYVEAPALRKPMSLGGHNWQPMAFSPKTGLVYIPAQEMVGLYAQDREFRYRPGAWNTGIDFAPIREFPRAAAAGHLLAWDPVARRERWRVQYSLTWNGGTLATAGNLVFQGTADGRFVAYRADDGEKLWESWAGSGVIAAPVTYLVDGVQHVSVMAGWGGAFALVGGDAAAAANVAAAGRLLTYRLDANAEPPPPTEPVTRSPPPQVQASAETVERGARLYGNWCAVCHGLGAVGGGVISDLRHSRPWVFDRYAGIVLEGMYVEMGMPTFEKWLTQEDVETVRAYVLKRAAETAERK